MEKDTVVIVPCEEKHMEDALRITVQAWTIIHEEFIRCIGEDLHETVMGNWQAEKTEEVARKLRSGNGYVALLNDKVVGFISYAVVGDVGVVGGNAVDLSCRGHGIAGKMYNFVLDKMRSQGLKAAQVHTGLDDAHAPARKAYEKAGFRKNLPSVTYYKDLREEA